MSRIYMEKAGFVRSKEDDFSDDGNYFTAYKVGNVRVTKLVSKGEAYIDADYNDGRIPCDVYCTLPHYKALSKLNGVNADSVTAEDLKELYDACVAYEKEYNDLCNTIVYPTREELTERLTAVAAKRKEELTTLGNMLTMDVLVKMSDYSVKYVKNYCAELYNRSKKNVAQEVDRVYKTSYSFTIMKDTNALQDSWYYTQVRAELERYI